MLHLIFAPEHGYEADARQRVAAMIDRLPQLPPIPAVTGARVPQTCCECYLRPAWSSPAGEPAFCAECRVDRLKSGGELDEELAERARQPAVF